MFQAKVVEEIKTLILYSAPFFRKSLSFLDNLEKYDRAGQAKMTIWRMLIACWITKATHTYSEYVILAFPQQ
jgi:hypothetical protein